MSKAFAKQIIKTSYLSTSLFIALVKPYLLFILSTDRNKRFRLFVQSIMQHGDYNAQKFLQSRWVKQKVIDKKAHGCLKVLASDGPTGIGVDLLTRIIKTIPLDTKGLRAIVQYDLTTGLTPTYLSKELAELILYEDNIQIDKMRFVLKIILNNNLLDNTDAKHVLEACVRKYSGRLVSRLVPQYDLQFDRNTASQIVKHISDESIKQKITANAL